LVEIGPSAALTGLAKRNGAAADRVWVTSLHSDDEQERTIRHGRARCYEAGVAVDWAGYHRGRRRRRVPLPGYVFGRKRYPMPGARVAAAPPGTRFSLATSPPPTGAPPGRGTRVPRPTAPDRVRQVTWRRGTRASTGNRQAKLRSHFLAIRIRPANRQHPGRPVAGYLLSLLDEGAAFEVVDAQTGLSSR